MKKFYVNRKSNIYFLEYMKLKEWMFLDNEFTQIEIINPTLENIELMEKYGLKFVVKG